MLAHRRGVQAGAALASDCLPNVAQSDGTNQDAVALDQRQIGGHDQICTPKKLTYSPASRFSKQPRPGPRWTQRKGSPELPLLVQKLLRAALGQQR